MDNNFSSCNATDLTLRPFWRLKFFLVSCYPRNVGKYVARSMFCSADLPFPQSLS